MSAVITDITQLVSFPQSGVHYRHRTDPTVADRSVVATKTGQIVTIMFAFILDIDPGLLLEHIEMTLPPGFQGDPVHGCAGNYSYSAPLAPLPAPPDVQGPQVVAGVYIDSSKHPPSSLYFYPAGWETFPPSNDYFFTGQMTYVALS